MALPGARGRRAPRNVLLQASVRTRSAFSVRQRKKIEPTPLTKNHRIFSDGIPISCAQRAEARKRSRMTIYRGFRDYRSGL